MGAGSWAPRAAGVGLILWLFGAAVLSAEGMVAVEPQVVGPGSAPVADAGPDDQVVRPVSAVPRVRPVKEGVFEATSLLREAERRSPSIRRLLASLEQTDAVIYVELMPSVPNRTGQLTFMAANRSFRMFRISLDMRNQRDDQIKWLGHELAHALEVAAAPEVRSEADMKRLFARIGWRVDGGLDFETYNAEETGRLVKEEISRR